MTENTHQDPLAEQRQEMETLVAEDVEYRKAHLQARLERDILRVFKDTGVAFRDLAAAVVGAVDKGLHDWQEELEILAVLRKPEPEIPEFQVEQLPLPPLRYTDVTIRRKVPQVDMTVTVEPAEWVVAMQKEIAEIVCTTPEHILVTVEGAHHLHIELDTANPVNRQELDAVVQFVEANKLTHVSFDIRGNLLACPDCGGTGEYVGLRERRACPTCRGGS